MITVIILARPQIDLSEITRFLQMVNAEWRRTTGAAAAEEIIEIAGRICYMSFGVHQSPKANSDYVRHLISQGHESVLEHVNWTFGITGVSRAFTHQLVRHRIGFSFSQLSQQYHDESEAEFIEPPGICEFPEIHRLWKNSVEMARVSYRSMLQKLADRETETPISQKERLRNIRSAARSVLPNATETTVVVTANARALRHFLRVRGSIEGDSEMRLACTAILRELQKDTVELFSDFVVVQRQDGLPIVEHRPSAADPSR